MTALLIVMGMVGLLAALDAAAMLWGADSRDGLNSPEWERRRAWSARHR